MVEFLCSNLYDLPIKVVVALPWLPTYVLVCFEDQESRASFHATHSPPRIASVQLIDTVVDDIAVLLPELSREVLTHRVSAHTWVKVKGPHPQAKHYGDYAFVIAVYEPPLLPVPYGFALVLIVPRICDKCANSRVPCPSCKNAVRPPPNQWFSGSGIMATLASGTLPGVVETLGLLTMYIPEDYMEMVASVPYEAFRPFEPCLSLPDTCFLHVPCRPHLPEELFGRGDLVRIKPSWHNFVRTMSNIWRVASVEGSGSQTHYVLFRDDPLLPLRLYLDNQTDILEQPLSSVVPTLKYRVIVPAETFKISYSYLFHHVSDGDVCSLAIGPRWLKECSYTALVPLESGDPTNLDLLTQLWEVDWPIEIRAKVDGTYRWVSFYCILLILYSIFSLPP